MPTDSVVLEVKVLKGLRTIKGLRRDSGQTVTIQSQLLNSPHIVNGVVKSFLRLDSLPNYKNCSVHLLYRAVHTRKTQLYKTWKKQTTILLSPTYIFNFDEYFFPFQKKKREIFSFFFNCLLFNSIVCYLYCSTKINNSQIVGYQICVEIMPLNIRSSQILIKISYCFLNIIMKKKNLKIKKHKKTIKK